MIADNYRVQVYSPYKTIFTTLYLFELQSIKYIMGPLLVRLKHSSSKYFKIFFSEISAFDYLTYCEIAFWKNFESTGVFQKKKAICAELEVTVGTT